MTTDQGITHEGITDEGIVYEGEIPADLVYGASKMEPR